VQSVCYCALGTAAASVGQVRWACYGQHLLRCIACTLQLLYISYTLHVPDSLLLLLLLSPALRYEDEGRARKVVRAQQLWFAVLEAQIETGNPYMLYKDACNRKSNQQNLGTIKCSNLCTEIVEYTSPDETAVCNLASIALPRFVREQGSQVRQARVTDVVQLVRTACLFVQLQRCLALCASRAHRWVGGKLVIGWL
jgi:hypothetical protein